MQFTTYVLLAAGLITLSACQPISASMITVAAPAQVQAEAQIEEGRPSIFETTLAEVEPVTAEISTAELQQILADGSAVVFDTRPFMEFAVSHIPGALNVAPKPGMSMSEYTSDVAEIGRLIDENLAQPVVLYCNGPYCGKSKRVSEDLLAAGYTNVRRYQLGAPVWRALVGIMQVELEGAQYIYENDATAVFVDARMPEEFDSGTITLARNIPLEQVAAAKDDGRLPMEDHNTRIIVFGEDESQARDVALEIAKNAFHNVTYFAGEYEDIAASLSGK